MRGPPRRTAFFGRVLPWEPLVPCSVLDLSAAESPEKFAYGLAHVIALNGLRKERRHGYYLYFSTF